MNKLLLKISYIWLAFLFTSAFTQKHPINLYQKNLSTGECEIADATDFTTGIIATPPWNYKGYYKNDKCEDEPRIGYIPNLQKD